MRITTPYKLGLLGLVAALALGVPVGAQLAKKNTIGLFTAVAGKVMVTHVGQPAATPAKLHADVYFKDVIETRAGARAKALFQDDSILTVGEQSRVEVSEHVYNPANNQRSTVLKLVQGKARVLVGKFFAGAGSKFDVHTDTAVATARGTYFVVWLAAPAGTTGVANIGTSGVVGFTSAGQTVEVGPRTFSFALPGAPPSPPVTITPTSPAGVSEAIAGTEVSDMPKEESSAEVAKKSGEAPGAEEGQPGSLLPPSPVTPPSVISGSGRGAASGSPGGPTIPGSPAPPSDDDD